MVLFVFFTAATSLLLKGMPVFLLKCMKKNSEFP